jgi:hypothetical protein
MICQIPHGKAAGSWIKREFTIHNRCKLGVMEDASRAKPREEDEMDAELNRTLLSGIVVCSLLLATPVQGRTLVNLTSTGATLAAGNDACPEQPYFRYVGGKPDNFKSPADPAYPSPDLVSFMTTPPSVQGIIDYDVPMANGRFGDSFNLQNTRSVCYALIKFRAKQSFGGASNDGLTIGHVESGGSPFTVVAQVIDPGAPPFIQTYAFDATGRTLLSDITGVLLNKTPLDSILDVYLQDDTKIDFIQLWVWYGPNCSETSPPTC